LQNKAQLVEPIDFETFILKNKTLLQNDPQRELLLYPSDDVSVSIIKSCSWSALRQVGHVAFGIMRNAYSILGEKLKGRYYVIVLEDVF
jgi:hypothetical protein